MVSRSLLLNLAAAVAAIASVHSEPFLAGPFDYLAVIPAPPEDSSPAGLADLDTVLQVQAERTEKEIALAKRVDGQSPFSFGRPVLGDWFRSANLPRTAEIMRAADSEATKVCDAAKAHFTRKRPYVRDLAVHPIVGKPGNTSYPSGHSFGATVWGTILSEAFPQHAAEFEQQIHLAMWGRVIAGAHYPTDTQAGMLLGKAVAKRMLENPELRKEIQEIRDETAKYMKPEGAPSTAGT